MENLTLSITTIGDLLLRNKITRKKDDKPIDNVRLTIPEYQRPYKWTARNAIQLLDDILEARNSNKEVYRVGTLILQSPYPKNSIEDKFWYGEKMSVKGHQSVGSWKKIGKNSLQDADEHIKILAKRLTPEQFGIVTYVSALYGKWCPYDEQSWIREY